MTEVTPVMEQAWTDWDGLDVTGLPWKHIAKIKAGFMAGFAAATPQPEAGEYPQDKPVGAGWSEPPKDEAAHNERLTSAELTILGNSISDWAYAHLAKGYSVHLTVREVKRILAALSLQPIDTAPRDETWLELYRMEQGEPELRAGFWSDDEGAETPNPGWYGSEADSHSLADFGFVPTHYRVLEQPK